MTRTIEERAAFLIIAGDVFDGDWRDYSTGLFFTREIARLGRAGIPTYAVRGNHDAESRITRRLDLPPRHPLQALLLDCPEGPSFAQRRPPDHTSQAGSDRTLTFRELGFPPL